MKNPRGRWLAPLLLSMATAAPVLAQDQAQNAAQDQAQQLRVLRDTTIALLNELVQQGVLSRAKADELIRKAEEAGKAGSGAPVEAQAGAPGAAPAAPTGPAAGAAGAAAVPPGVVRVPYIPETVKQEIKDQVKQEVVQQAKTERWGVPGMLPDWIDRITWYGDVRVRYQGERFPTDDVPNATPQEFSLPQFGALPLTNTADPVNILRIRARVGLTANLGDTVTAGIGLASGGVGLGTNGASESQTLGNYTSRESVGFDLAYVNYHPTSWLSFVGGRLGDPFFHPTTLVWANDLSLEGVLATLTPHLGDHFILFVTGGAFPILDVEPSPITDSTSKWLYGYQAGFHWKFLEHSALHFGVALYDYRNIEGILNPTPFSQIYTATAAPFRQGGNSVFDIDELANTQSGLQNYVIGLASKFHEANAAAELDLGFGSRTHVMLDLDYVKNLGFDARDILQRTGLVLAERTRGAQTMLKVGDPDFVRRYNWQLFAGYRYVQRDSVVDAFTDADFQLGGTNAQGYIVGGEFAFERNSTLRARWMSSKQIDGLPLAIGLLQVDVTSSF